MIATHLCFLALAALAVWWARGQGSPARLEPVSWAAPAVVALSAGMGLARWLVAAGRTVRSVDEYQYAAMGAWIRHTGTPLFGWAWSPRGHQPCFLWAESPFGLVDGVTSAVIALGAGWLGWLVLRLTRDPWAGLAAVPLYVLGLLHFEGLTSNAEPYADLFLIAWACVRLGTRSVEPARVWVGGACLGAAALMKEQALLFVFVEPALAAFDAWRGRAAGVAGSARRFLTTEALAALGYLTPLALLLLGFAAQGQLGTYLSWLAGWAGSGGVPALYAALEVPPPPPSPPGPAFVVQLGHALTELWLQPVGLLGGLGLGVALVRPGRGRRGRAAFGFVALILLGLVAISIGRRWFGHYFMLLWPGLTGLASLLLADLARGLRRPRATAAAVILLALGLSLSLELGFLRSEPGWIAAQGNGLSGGDLARAQAVSEALAERSAPGETLLVWGWRPELYAFSGLPPTTRFVGGVTADLAQVLSDLERFGPPSAVVFPGEQGLGADLTHDPFRPESQPQLSAWLRARRYARLAPREATLGYEIWLPPAR